MAAPPAAASLGPDVSPVASAWKSVQHHWAKKKEQHQRSARVEEGVEEVRRSTQAERDAIVNAFLALRKDTDKRQKQWGEGDENAMFGDNAREQ